MVLIYDGYCGICTRLVAWIRLQDPEGRIEALPSQLPGVIERYGLTREQVQREVWLFDDSGASWSGADAVFRTLEALGGAWSDLGRWGRSRWVRPFSGPAYHWFAQHRHWFSQWGVPPECDDPDRGCLPP